jgi:iron complex transport system substrate-binding protein
MPELVAMAGGRDVLGQVGRRSGWLTWEALRAADPEVLVVSPCGFSLERVEREVEVLTAQPGWRELSAVRSGRVYLAEANQYFNRPGPRLAETLEILAEMLHPGVFAFGHEGTAWRRLGEPPRVRSSLNPARGAARG